MKRYTGCCDITESIQIHANFFFQVKVLYVKNLTSDVTEEMIKEEFSKHGTVERVKKIKDYGFVHFDTREGAEAALNALNGEVCIAIIQFKCLRDKIGGSCAFYSWAVFER